ncbi:MAG: response regulator [Christensenellaceae bacterium]|jgi:signal transduction histidine kinase|nr:response regulator [Christensenellaceae bacterium]
MVTPSTYDVEQLNTEIIRLQAEVNSLKRELRITNGYVDRVNKTITAKTTLNESLALANARQNEYIGMLLNSCRNIIMLYDKNAECVLCTNVFLKITSTHNFGMIKGKTFFQIFDKYLDANRLEFFRDKIQEITSGTTKEIRFSEWLSFNAEEPRYYSIEVGGISTTSDQSVMNGGYLIVFSDYTDFERERQRAETANNAKSEFLANMSHEIRTPMNVILGVTDILMRTQLDSMQMKNVSDIKKSSQSLLTIINDILDFSKIESGKLVIIESPYNLSQLLESLSAVFSNMAHLKNLDFELIASQDLPQFVYGDETRLRQILTNLLSNACKYTNSGKITLSATVTNDKLIFDVKDTGIGIKKEDVDKLFTPFEQLDLRKNRHIVGTGLGLAISCRLCELMNGRLSLVSEYGTGSVFTAEVPYVSALSNDVNYNSFDNFEEFFASKAKVLVVDDIEINLEVAGALLEIFGIVPVFASSAEVSIQLAKETEFDLIFMDQMMPVMDGIEATKIIRSLGGHNATVPIIALTANALSGVGEMFLKNKFSDYIFKPIELHTLGACIKKWLPKDLIDS